MSFNHVDLRTIQVIENLHWKIANLKEKIVDLEEKLCEAIEIESDSVNEYEIELIKTETE